jgi:SET domain-containing protein
MHRRALPKARSQAKLYVAAVGAAGRGVFCAAPLARGQLIEVCPVILMPRREDPHLKRTTLRDYYFEFSARHFCVALGLGSLYNHAYDPNAFYESHEASRTLRFYARRAIAAGTEITVNYLGDPTETGALWFEPRRG